MTTYTIEYTDTEETAMLYVTGDVNAWIQNFAHERARAASEEIVAMEVQKRLNAGIPIPSTREEIIMQADLTRHTEPQPIPGEPPRPTT